jgi:hypothetical protein
MASVALSEPLLAGAEEEELAGPSSELSPAAGGEPWLHGERWPDNDAAQSPPYTEFNANAATQPGGSLASGVANLANSSACSRSEAGTAVLP